MEVNITLRCNGSCDWCSRLLDIRKITSDSDMTIEQAEGFVKQLRDDNVRIRRLKITGGEPTLHPDLEQITQILGRDKNVVRKIALQTVTQRRVPGAYRTLFSPVRFKEHLPFLVSPFDLGAVGRSMAGWNCGIQKGCGIAFEKWGFMACGSSGTLGRLLGIDPYYQRPTMKGNPEICRHCIFSVGPEMRNAVRKAAKDGEIKHPTKTFRERLPEYLETGNVDREAWSYKKC